MRIDDGRDDSDRAGSGRRNSDGGDQQGARPEGSAKGADNLFLGKLTSNADLSAWRKHVAAEVEYVLQIELGMADPAIADHLTHIVVRSLRSDGLLPRDPRTGQAFDNQAAALALLTEDRGKQERRCFSAAELADFYTGVGDYALYQAGAGRNEQRASSRRSGLAAVNPAILGSVAYLRATMLTPESQEREARTRITLHKNFLICAEAIKQAQASLSA